MSFRFHVLASGSSGNACVLQSDGFGVLIDFGLSPRALAPRMRRCGIGWNDIHAVLLTHPHSDHWRPATLAHLAKLGLPIFCHREHQEHLDPASRASHALSEAGLFREYEPGERLRFQTGWDCLPIELAHDGPRTCGFRFEGRGWALGYLADLGSWTEQLAAKVADVDLLALEFNHDVPMQLGSGRHPTLIRRVLGDHGHLSNDQAADLLSEIVKRSERGRLRHLVQLHLSQHCNRADLAHATALRALERLDAEIAIFTAHQEQTGKTIRVGAAKPVSSGGVTQPTLPFAD